MSNGFMYLIDASTMPIILQLSQSPDVSECLTHASPYIQKAREAAALQVLQASGKSPNRIDPWQPPNPDRDQAAHE